MSAWRSVPSVLDAACALRALPGTAKADRMRQALPPLLVNPYGLSKAYPWPNSVSEIDTFNLCQRKWGFRWIDKIKRQNRFAERGTKMHDIAEAYLVLGEQPDTSERYGLLFSKGIKFLPPARLPTLEVERKFEYISESGIWYIGAQDYVWPENEFGLVQIGDHKSLTKFKWALNEESLRNNTQAGLYTEVQLARFERTHVMLKWHYYQDTKKPSARTMTTALTRDQAAATVRRMDETAHAIARHRRTLSQGDAKQLPGNVHACEMYRGCSYRDICPLSNEEKMEAIMTQQTIRERLLARSGSNGGAAQMGVPAPVNGQAAPPAAVSAAPPPGAPAVTGSAREVFERAQLRAAAGATPPPVTAQLRSAPPPALVPPPSAAPPAAPPAAAPADSALSRLQRHAPAAQDAVHAAGMQAAYAAAGIDDTQPYVTPQHAPSDVNPPEQPQTPVDNPEDLARGAMPAAHAVQSAPQAERRKPGRPKGATASALQPADMTGVSLAADAEVFARVYASMLGLTSDHELSLDAGKDAVEYFRRIT